MVNWIGLGRAMSRLSASTYVEFHQATNHTFDPYMPIVVMGAVLGAKHSTCSGLLRARIVEMSHLVIHDIAAGDPRYCCAADHLMRSEIQVGLRIIEEVSREHRRPQISKRVGQLLIAPTGLLSGLPGGVGNVSRIGSRFPD